MNLRYVLFLACTAATGGLLFGFDIAIISGAGPFLATHFELGDFGLGFAFNSCCLDARVRAAVLLASARPSYPGEAFPAPGVPALVVHGDADTRAAYADGRRLYEELRAPKFLLTIHGGEHTPPFSGATQRADARVVVDSVVAFLDRYLKDDAGATDRLVGIAASEPLVATLERA